MILFYCIETPPRKICIVETRSVRAYLENISTVYPHGFKMLCEVRSRPGAIVALKNRFRPLEGPLGWYTATPELLAYVEGLKGIATPELDRKRRLDDSEALAVFRAAHDPLSGGDRAVAERFGVSAITVGSIARGQTHKRLFRQTPAEGYGSGWYYISEDRDGAARYLLRFGSRSR